MRIIPIQILVDGIDIRGEVYLPQRYGVGLLPAVCLCHGIPASAPDPTDKGYALLAERLCSMGFATVIFNFRGAGASGGNLDMLGWSRDLHAVVSYLHSHRDIDPARLGVMGFSGGAAVAVYVAAHDPRVSAVALCACPAEFGFILRGEDPHELISHFRSISTIRDSDFPSSIPEWVNGFRESAPQQWIDSISPRHLLIVHGDKDEIVEVSHAWSLYHKAREPKEIAIIDGGEHKLRLNNRAMDIVLEWLQKHL